MMTEINRSRFSIYLESALVGSLQTLVTFPLEHPLDVIKTRLQSLSSSKGVIVPSSVEMARKIFKDFGIVKGFYAGALPNSLRVVVKSLYRWPLMVGLPEFFKTHVLPVSSYEAAHKVTAGVVIAVIESFIICPFERVKVFLMTKHSSDVSAARYVKSRGMLELFRGLNAQVSKQVVSWVSFLYIDFKVKQAAKRFQCSETLTNPALLACAITTGVLNTLCSLPLDKVKTLYQMQAASVGGDPSLQDQRGMLKMVKNTLQSEGVGGFYAGWRPRMLQYSIQAIFTCTLLEKFEEKLQQRRRPVAAG